MTNRSTKVIGYKHHQAEYENIMVVKSVARVVVPVALSSAFTLIALIYAYRRIKLGFI